MLLAPGEVPDLLARPAADTGCGNEPEETDFVQAAGIVRTSAAGARVVVVPFEDW